MILPFHPRLLRHLDWPMIVAAMGLTFIGLITIYSIGFQQSVASGFWIPSLLLKQIMAWIVALAFFVLFTYLDFRLLHRFAPWFYGCSVLLLLLVPFLGESVYGAQRWIFLGPIGLQPSEFAKLGLIIMLSAFLAKPRFGYALTRTILPSLFWFAIPFLLIFQQPDLGTALILLGIFFGLLIWGKTPAYYLIAFVAPLLSFLTAPLFWIWLGVLIISIGYFFLARLDRREAFFFSAATLLSGLSFPIFWKLLKPYQQLRFLSFLNPGLDPHGAGYHTIQSKIAIGAGGFWGKGFLAGTQTQFNFIPEQSTDFIFSALAEEWGLWLCLILIALYLLLVLRMLWLAKTSPDLFSSYLACGIAVMVMLHFFVNIGMTTGLLPVVGVPLPFVSVGGTSLVIHWSTLGILESVKIRKQNLTF